MTPPPDIDKYSHGHEDTNSCRPATAANMPAGAGYGDGNDVNENSAGLKAIFWLPLHTAPLPPVLLRGRHFGMEGGPGGYYAPNMCGGYVICAFDIYEDPREEIKTGEYRFRLEYDYFQDPEQHICFVEPAEPTTCFMGNFRFGHSYGLLLEHELWQFEQWRTFEFIYPEYPPLMLRQFILDREGQVPYPQGQDYKTPQQCGDEGTDYAVSDLDKDCYVNFSDFAIFALERLTRTHPRDPNCPW